MNKECLSHLLMEEERNHFEEQVYVYVQKTLSLDMTPRLNSIYSGNTFANNSTFC